MTYNEWLSRHTKRSSPLGDLARDVQTAGDTGELPNTLAAWKDYLEGYAACQGAINALTTSWKSYKAYLRKHPEE